jgi:ADP-heptose:LPS heptosyltransferase
MGDVLLSTPAYREILKHFPNAEILTRKESKAIPKLKVHTSWETIGKVDIAIHLHTSLKTNLILWFKRIPIRVGYSYKWCGIPLTHRIPLKTRTIRQGYRVDEVCDLLEKAFGWKIENREMEC